jgi:hypothetical protein
MRTSIIQPRTLHQISEEDITRALEIVEAHNRIVNPNNYSVFDKENITSYYIVSVTGKEHCYYTLYSYNNMCLNPRANPQQYITNLSINLIEAVNKICTGRGKPVVLDIEENLNIKNINPTRFQFGKYINQPITEVYKTDPKYIIWAALNMSAKNKRQQQVIDTLIQIKDAHFQMITENNIKTNTSTYQHKPKQRLILTLTPIHKYTPKPDPINGLLYPKTKYKLTDQNNNQYQLYSHLNLELNTTYQILTTIKSHKTILGIQTTTLTRPTLSIPKKYHKQNPTNNPK